MAAPHVLHAPPRPYRAPRRVRWGAGAAGRSPGRAQDPAVSPGPAAPASDEVAERRGPARTLLSPCTALRERRPADASEG